MSTNTTVPSTTNLTESNGYTGGLQQNQSSIARHIRGLGTASLECSPGGNSFVPLPTTNNSRIEDPNYHSVQEYDHHNDNDYHHDNDDYNEDDIDAFRDTIMGGSETNSVHGVRTGRNGMVFERVPPQVLNMRTPATHSSSSITSMSNSAVSTSTITQGNHIIYVVKISC